MSTARGNGAGLSHGEGLLLVVVSSQGKLNVVLFHGAAGVQEMDITKGAEISTQLSHDIEDGPEIDYWVFEEVPPEVPSPPSEAASSLSCQSLSPLSCQSISTGGSGAV
jgi:hypothetical protein